MNASDRGAIDKAWQENAPLAQARGGQGRTTGMYRAYVFILPRATCLNCILGCWFSVHPVQDKQEVREGTSAGSKVWDRGQRLAFVQSVNLHVILVCILTVRTLLCKNQHGVAWEDLTGADIWLSHPVLN